MSSGQTMLAREQQLIPECVRYSLEFERLGGGRSEDAGSGDGHVPMDGHVRMAAAGGLEMMRPLDSHSHSPHPQGWNMSSANLSASINPAHHPHFGPHPAAQFGDANMGEDEEREMGEMHAMGDGMHALSSEDAALRSRKWHKASARTPLAHDALLRSHTHTHTCTLHVPSKHTWFRV